MSARHRRAEDRPSSSPATVSPDDAARIARDRRSRRHGGRPAGRRPPRRLGRERAAELAGGVRAGDRDRLPTRSSSTCGGPPTAGSSSSTTPASAAGRSAGCPTRSCRARVKDGQAPALEEALELVAGRIAVDVELKEDGYVEQAMATIRRRLAPDQYVVTSFRDSVLPAVKQAEPAGAHRAAAAARAATSASWSGACRRTGVDFLAPHARLSRARRCSPGRPSAGCPPGCGRSTSAGRCASICEDPRVAAVITDRPDRALAELRAIDRRRSLTFTNS